MTLMNENLKADLTGRICPTVTGATGGIGLAAARALAQMGATVVLVGRSAPRTAQVVEEIHLASGNPNVTYALADLFAAGPPPLGRRVQKQVSVPACPAQQRQQETSATRQFSVDGIEMTFALNHLAYSS